MEQKMELCQSLEAMVEKTIARVGKNIVLGAPLAAGKPNHIINAFYKRAFEDKDITLTIATALTLERPKGASLLEKNFLTPMAERVFGNYPDLDYEIDRQKGKLPSNIEVVEFYFPPGKFASNKRAQRNYVSSNYTHVVRDMLDRNINVLVQQVAKEGDFYSLSCNADVTTDLAPLMRESGRPVCMLAQVNQNLPFMYGDAVVDRNFFDFVIDNKDQYYTVFGPPKMSVSDVDFMIGLYACALVKDDGELQVGIGSLGDAIIYGLVLRHNQNALFLRLIDELGVINKNKPIIDSWGDIKPFNMGLFGATEMVVDGFMELYKCGILKKKVFDHLGLQRLINEGLLTENFDRNKILDLLLERRIIASPLSNKDFDFLVYWGILRDDLTFKGGVIHLPDGQFVVADLNVSQDKKDLQEKCFGSKLKHGHVIHGGFFLGPQSFYDWLKSLPKEERKLISMKSVQKINQLYGHEDLDRLHRKNARFINTCMMTTLSGAHVSDGLEDGRVVSGVGGQYNFVAMAQELPDGRSVLTMRSTRMHKGKLVSNIVPFYGHITVPRHMRDILVTEYGIADLRGKTDEEIAIALIKIADSRFQDELILFAKKHGKLRDDYVLPDSFRQNLPQSYLPILAKYKAQGLFNPFPFGTDLTFNEIKVGKALKVLKAHKAKGGLSFIKVLLKSLFACQKQQDVILLERMKLLRPKNIEEFLMKKLLIGRFRELHY